MKTRLVFFAVLLAFAGTVKGQSSSEVIADLLKNTPVFTQDEMSRTRFSAAFSSNYTQPMLEYVLYNPCRDKGIDGIVVTIHSEADSDKEPAFDLFIPVECGPLQCRSNQQTVPVLKMEQAKRSPSVVLKEVHYTPLPKVDNASH